MSLTPGKFYWIQAAAGVWPSGVQPARFDGLDGNGTQKWNLLAGASVSGNIAWVGDEVLADPNQPPPPPPPAPTPTPAPGLAYKVSYDFGDCRDTRGRTAVDPTIFKQARTMVIVYEGQSMQGNYGLLTPYTPSGAVYDLNVYDGKVYRCDGGPVFGSDGWAGRLSILPYLCDVMTWGGSKALRVLRVGIIKGGTSAYDWTPLNPLSTRRKTAVQALAAIGLAPNRWVSVQGQGDLAGRPGQATDATNYRNLRAWGFQDIRAAGYAGQIMVGVGCHWTGFSNIYPAQAAAIRGGQVALASDGDPNVQPVILGPDDDQWVPDEQYRVDGVHWADVGRYYSAQAWAAAIPAV